MRLTSRPHIWLLMVAFLLVSCGGTDEAKRGVDEFRTRVAQKSYSEIYRAAAAELRQATTEEEFVRFMTALDRKLGSWQSAAEPVWNVTRGTAGHVVNLTYQSQFAKGAANEQFTWRIESGRAILLGYHVNSPLLVTE